MLSEILKKLRKAKSLSQQGIADRLHVKRATYAAWEEDRATPDLAMSLKIAQLYAMTVDDLLGNIQVKETKPTISDKYYAAPAKIRKAIDILLQV